MLGQIASHLFLRLTTRAGVVAGVLPAAAVHGDRAGEIPLVLVRAGRVGRDRKLVTTATGKGHRQTGKRRRCTRDGDTGVVGDRHGEGSGASNRASPRVAPRQETARGERLGNGGPRRGQRDREANNKASGQHQTTNRILHNVYLSETESRILPIVSESGRAAKARGVGC